MWVFGAEQDSSEYGFLKSIFEKEARLLELLTDEADREDRHFLHDQIVVIYVRRDLVCDSVPLVPGYFDAANRCYDLNNYFSTLAAALRITFSLSIMVFSTESFSDALPPTLSRSHKNIEPF